MTTELDQRTVMKELLQANYSGVAFTFPPGHMFAPRLMGAAMDGVHMTDVKMASADIRFCSMTGAILTRVDLSSAQGQEIGWSRSVLQDVSLYRGFFSRAVVRDARFLNCHLERTFLDNMPAQGSVWDGCRGNNIVFDKTEFEGAVFRKLSTIETSFMEADLRQATFKECHFTRADFSLACLNQARFEDCVLDDCSFSGCVGVGLTFERTRIIETYLSPKLTRVCKFIDSPE